MKENRDTKKEREIERFCTKRFFLNMAHLEWLPSRSARRGT
jgi:hypothetical protein